MAIAIAVHLPEGHPVSWRPTSNSPSPKCTALSATTTISAGSPPHFNSAHAAAAMPAYATAMPIMDLPPESRAAITWSAAPCGTPARNPSPAILNATGPVIAGSPAKWAPVSTIVPKINHRDHTAAASSGLPAERRDSSIAV